MFTCHITVSYNRLTQSSGGEGLSERASDIRRLFQKLWFMATIPWSPLCASHSFIQVHSMHLLPSFAKYFSSVLHRRLWIVMEWLESWGGTLGNANGNAHADNNTRFQQSQNDIPVTSMCSTLTSIFVASFDFDMYKFEMCLIDIWTTLRIVWLKFEKWWRPGQAFLWARAAFQTLGNTL